MANPPKSSPPKRFGSVKLSEVDEEETLQRLLVPPSPLKRLAEWRAKMTAQHSFGPPPPRKPTKR
jgi:hypothetical protein